MTRTELLEKARATVCGDREQDYGSPENSFQRIAEFWGAYLNQQITPVDVAAMMALLKLARVAEGHAKEDNWVDLAGYAACGAEIESSSGAEEPRNTPVGIHNYRCVCNTPSCLCVKCKNDNYGNGNGCCKSNKNATVRESGSYCCGVIACTDYEEE